MEKSRGAVACGHEVTRDAAADILRAGGNAFDAVAAALWAACVAEPLLASPGGGGFLLAKPAEGSPRVYDFFTHTPRQALPPEDADFREILVDFGPARQAFHIGLGSTATPGVVAGVLGFQGELGLMPTREVMAPALHAARHGVTVNRFQAYVASILAPILEATEGARRCFEPEDRPVQEGDLVRRPELADLLDALSREGGDLFYRGEVARMVDRAFRERGGHLRREDFEAYRVVRRQPLEAAYRGRRIVTNPPPASGGLLVSFGLRVMESVPPGTQPTDADSMVRIAWALAAMQAARAGENLADDVDLSTARSLLDASQVARYRDLVAPHPKGRDGTTHISVIDAAGNAASLSVSNGEGCGWVVPGTGMMLNNMLGEADLQPGGLGRWPPDVRLTSMMTPTLLEDPDGSSLAVLGSGGSNRIRSAVLQVTSGLADHEPSLEELVARPRLHIEDDRLEIEGGLQESTVAALTGRWEDCRLWPELNLFFGGTHVARSGPRGMAAAGDPRRGGAAVVV